MTSLIDCARPLRRLPTQPLLAVALLLLAACGASTPQAAAPTSDPDAQPAAGETTVEYGASLDEWEEANAASGEPEPTAQRDYPAGYEEEIFWEDLLAPGFSNVEIWDRYAERLDELEDGSPEAEVIYAEMQAEYEANADKVNTELDGINANLVGFVTPLSNADDVITEFLLVPYFGACIHVPPPPPNQTVLVTLPEGDGIGFEDSWGPVWVAGTLTIDTATTDLATVSYKLTGVDWGVYDE